ncbi:MAG TPA: hypothetical protein VKY36_02635 [Moheibacter sp.]|nr:hypothetical protein [Moheibacter sp.]
MTTIKLKINERTKKGKAFLEFAKTFFEEGKEVELIETEKETKLSSQEKEFLYQFSDSVKEMKEISSGKRKAQSLQSFLDEL